MLIKPLLSLLLAGAFLPLAAYVPPDESSSNLAYFGRRTVPQPALTSANSPLPGDDAFRPAAYLVTGADDFVVEVYLNGKLVPASQRELLAEVFGATAEKIKVEVKSGDWVVFNVVNNRLRWGGAAYFGLAGMNEDGKPVFVSRLDDARWTCCDALDKVGEFIAQKDGKGEMIHRIPQVWDGGPKLMRSHAFKEWNGDAVWGQSPSTWIKFVYR